MSFAHTGRSLSLIHPELASPNANIPSLCISTQDANNLLGALSSTDTLNLRRFGQPVRCLDAIHVSPREEEGAVYYRTTSSSGEELGYFDSADNGKTLRWKSMSWTRCFKYLPDRVLRKIFGLVSAQPQGVTFDINTRIAHGLNIHLLHVSSHLNFLIDIPKIISNANDVTVKLRSTATSIDQDSFLYSRSGSRTFTAGTRLPA